MKPIANALVVIALVCVCLFAVHGFYLVRGDVTARTSAAAVQATVPSAPETVTPKPNPTVVREQGLVAEVSDPNTGGQPNGDPQAEAESLRHVDPQTPPRPPEAHTTTVSVMPSQAFNVPNRKFRKVLIRSEYPIRVYTGKCHNDYAVEFMCDGDPADIFIADTRRRPLILTPRANAVSITVTEF
jgi:hypothetical protein